jgi:lipopolysaccharide export system permease protein
VLSNLVFAIGLAGTLPVIIAAWTPALIILMLGVASLLHLEDG